MSKAQDLILNCIEFNSFNDFDGAVVVRELRKSADLWEAVIFHKYPNGELTLRDLPDDLYFDTLFIRSSGKNDEKLYSLMHELRADEINWLDDIKSDRFGGFKLYIPDRRVLRAWWD